MEGAEESLHRVPEKQVTAASIRRAAISGWSNAGRKDNDRRKIGAKRHRASWKYILAKGGRAGKCKEKGEDTQKLLKV